MSLSSLYVRIFLIVAALAILAGCNSSDGRPAQRSGGDATQVEVVVIKPQPIENTIFTTGTLLANEEVVLRPEIAGRVVGLYFEEGKGVKKGDLLVKINDNELQAQLKRKEFEEKLSADEEQRAKTLLDMNGISREEYDKSLNRLNMIKAEREIIESQLAETEVFAPFDGTIGLRYISEGTYVSTGTTIATMQDIDPIKVEFAVPEKYAGQLPHGTSIALRAGDKQQLYRGSVYAVEAKVDPNTRTLKARATVPNSKGDLFPGAFAKVEITLQHIPDAVVVPAEALIPDLAGERVFVLRNGVAESVQVTTGIRTDRSVQITEGLQPNDTLILTGLLQLSDGKPVQIKSTDNPMTQSGT
jgi:membrane fusion protein (multidrug efflux system)